MAFSGLLFGGNHYDEYDGLSDETDGVTPPLFNGGGAFHSGMFVECGGTVV